MRMIDKKLNQKGSYYDVETFLINKKIEDKKNIKLLKTITGCYRVDTAIKKAIEMYSLLNIDKRNNIIDQIKINENNFVVYNSMKKTENMSKNYYKCKLSKWSILIALNGINPINLDVFTDLLCKELISDMQNFIHLER